MEDKAIKYGYNVCMQMRNISIRNICTYLRQSFVILAFTINEDFFSQTMNAFTEKGIREMIGNTGYPKEGSH